MEFVADEFPDLQSLMGSCPSGVMRADAFRLLMPKRWGGLYVDLDFVKLKPLDWLPLSFSRAEHGDGVLCNAFLWAPFPEDPFLEGIEATLLARAERGDPVQATGSKLLTAHAESGRVFQNIPSSWPYPVAWDDVAKIRQIEVQPLISLQKEFPEAKAIHVWRNSWGGK